MEQSAERTTDALPWPRARHDRLVRLCTALTGDRVAADDLAQETYLQALRIADRLVDPAGLDPWLDAVARNVCRRWTTARGRRLSRERLVGDVPDTVAVDEDDLEAADLAVLLDRALGHLPDRDRDLLVARYVHQRTPSDIARTSSLTADAVAMRLTRAKRRLRHIVETRYADEVADGRASPTDQRWTTTRVRCTGCGESTLEMRRDVAEVAFRCPRCTRGGVVTSVAFRGALATVAEVHRPSAVLARIADWSSSYWRASTACCVACGAAVARRPFERAGVTDLGARHGWFARCDRCGEEVCSSVQGLVGALPEVRQARHRHPRLRFTRTVAVERDGVAALAAELAGPDGAPVVTAVVSRDTPRVLHVVV